MLSWLAHPSCYCGTPFFACSWSDHSPHCCSSTLQIHPQKGTFVFISPRYSYQGLNPYYPTQHSILSLARFSYNYVTLKLMFQSLILTWVDILETVIQNALCFIMFPCGNINVDYHTHNLLKLHLALIDKLEPFAFALTKGFKEKYRWWPIMDMACRYFFVIIVVSAVGKKASFAW